MKYKNLLIIYVIICFTSCFSAKSNLKNSTLLENDKIESLFIILEDKTTNKTGMLERLSVSLKEQLEAEGIPSETFIKAKMSLENDRDIFQMIKGSKMTHTLVISGGEGFRTGDHKYYFYTVTLQKSSIPINGQSLYYTILNQKIGHVKNSKQSANDAKLIIDDLKTYNFIMK